MIKLLMIDIDGFNPEENEPTPQVHSFFEKVSQQNIHVCLISSGSLESVSTYITIFRLKQTTFIYKQQDTFYMDEQKNYLKFKFDLPVKKIFLTKENALNVLVNSLNVKKDECIAFSSSLDNSSLLTFSFFSFGINRQDTHYSVLNFDDSIPFLYSLINDLISCPRCSNILIKNWMLFNPERLLGECSNCEYTSDICRFFNPIQT